MLKCWYTKDADGVVISSTCIVFALDEASARIFMDEALRLRGFHTGDYILHELPIVDGAHILFDGDL